ncbi:MAG: aminomethyl-transferring glycine dehydrogenase subunit GcvPA [Chloroflexi bacterium]|nr:aminomethyl-transferring glycine dehydrogenase subunit GcvPA [Chloroflexota bacterium]
MSYIPHTDVERQQMLSAIGVPTIEDLFEAVPAAYRFPKLDLPPALSEMEVLAELQSLAESNDSAYDFSLFRGAGAYHHYTPAAVNHMLLRGEFYTAYTPYQPEVSQGTLQAIFEYQTMISQLTGMDGANASHYDGATSLAEAVTVALEASRRKKSKVILSPYINPQYRAVARTYHQGNDVTFVGDEGAAELSDLVAMIDDNTAIFAVAYPNFLGQIEDFKGLADQVHAAGALLVFVANPLALALLKSPGELGADIVVGDGQTLGIPLSYGGPYVGFFATKLAQMRRIAGRIVGETVDKTGKKAYVMTLRPREQDIRREKATSNICTNQGLLALAATVYLSLMGKHGLKKAAELNYHKAHYAATQIAKIPGYEVDQSKPFFNEFVVKCPRPVREINEVLLAEGIIGGYELGRDYLYLYDRMLVCVTEMNTKAEIDVLVDILGEVK